MISAADDRQLSLLQGGGQAAPDGHVPPEAAPRPSPSDAWELPLQALLLGDQDQVGASEIGLQFELVLTPARPGPRPGAAPPGAGIRVRPVVPSRTGQWVRTGISWGTLDYRAHRHLRSRDAVERLSVVKELLALSRLSPHRYYGQAEPEVRLEAINSRRLWDLLREARDLQVPLLSSARQSRPVTLRSALAVATLDVTRVGTDLRLRPYVDVGDEHVRLASSVLLGRPAHGLAWWDEQPVTALRRNAGDTPQLHLAAFETPVDATLRAFIERKPVRVPKRDEALLRELTPTLRRKLAVVSSDGSVELPEAMPPTLALSVQYDGSHRIALAWARGMAGSPTREGLWDGAYRLHDRLGAGTIVVAVTEVVQSMPALLEANPLGARLAPAAHLDGMEAVRFVSELLPQLQEIPGLEIDHTGTRPVYRETAAAPVVSLTGSASGDRDWLDLTVEVTVGGEEVPFQELFVALAGEQTHLILPSGTYFALERAELRELADLITEARALHEAPAGGIRLSRFQASLWEDLQRIGVIAAQAGAWEASMLALAEAGDPTDHPVPDGLHAALRPYQQVGFNWLASLYEHRLGGVLADDMGLGKTLEALTLMCYAKEQGSAAGPFLVIAPTSVVQNWEAECRRFAPGLDVIAIRETAARRGVALSELSGRADVVITSYALFRLEYDAYAVVEWSGLFLDEAQFAKNRNSQTYKRAKTLPVAFKVAMTGTPMENNVMELWSLLSITAPGLFASPDRFEEHYRVPIEKAADIERLAQLRRRVRPLMLRRTKEQVAADLPEKQEQILELELNPRHKKLYQTYLARERQKVLGLLGDMSKNRFQIFRSLTLLRQASLDVSLIDPTHANVPSTKLDALMGMLTDIVADGHRVLVFSQFTRFLGEARRRIESAGIEHCYLDGRTRNRATVISEFQTGAAPVFLISLKAGGFGLNLTEADYCILLDPWWNPATEAQAVDRVHRIGQTRKVMVYRLVAKDTIEEKVMALKAKKAALFTNVMDSGGFESGALTAADIRGLLT
jgi:superfamily II DNA or RNA helicase